MKIFHLTLIFQLLKFGSSEYFIDCNDNESAFCSSGECMCAVHIKPGRGDGKYDGVIFGLTFNRLEEFEVSNAVLDELFEDFKNLTFLDLNERRLATFDAKTFENGKSLNYLTATRSSLAHIEDFSFKNLKLLLNIFLNINAIAEVSENAFFGLDSLEYLDLSNNKITNIHPNAFQHTTSLTVLLLGHNRIENLHENVFESLGKLEFLYFCNNRLQSLSHKHLQNTKNLTILELGGNQIRHFDRNILQVFQNLMTLDLTHNDCVDQLFQYHIKTPNDPLSILKIILFPFCDYKSSVGDSGSEIEITLIILLVIVLLLLISSILSCRKAMRMRDSRVVSLRYEAAKNTSRKIQDLVTEYIDQSSIHGIRYLGEQARHWTEK